MSNSIFTEQDRTRLNQGADVIMTGPLPSAALKPSPNWNWPKGLNPGVPGTPGEDRKHWLVEPKQKLLLIGHWTPRSSYRLGFWLVDMPDGQKMMLTPIQAADKFGYGGPIEAPAGWEPPPSDL